MIMLSLHPRFFVLAVLGVCYGHFASAQVVVSQDILAQIKKAQSAPQKLNFSGTFVYQQASQIRTSRISHIFDGKGELEKLEILDGRPREYIRHNDEVSCYLPDVKEIQTEKRVSQDVFPSVFTSGFLLLPESYTIHRSDSGRVAGIECDTLSFDAKDANRYSYRLCLEKSSGLLLRTQTLNKNNDVIEQIAFTQIAIGAFDKSSLKPSFNNTSHWRVDNLIVQAESVSGWNVKFLPPGFKKKSEMKRLIPMSGAANGAPANQDRSLQVIQMIFSDGLATMSVFIEPYSGNRVEGSLQQGAMTIMGKRQGDYWLTAVGEMPFAAIKQVIDSVEFKPR